MRLKDLRKQLNISAKQVSKDLDIPYTTYLNYEKETREPGLRMLNKLADYFNVSVDFLLDRTPVTTVPKEKGLSDNTLGERIRSLRKERGLTQEELANRLGYTHKSAINKIELNINKIPYSKIKEFADFFGVSPEYLLCFSDNDCPSGTAVFSKNLNIAMDTQKIKSVELSRRTNIPAAVISQYRSGRYKPARDRIVLIANCLNVSASWLVGFERSEKESRLLKAYNEHPEMQHAIDTLLGLQVNEK